MADRKITEAQRKARRKYNAKPSSKKKRAANNKARRMMIKAGKAKKGDGKDVDHIKKNNGKNTTKGNLRMRSRSANRKDNRRGGKSKS